MIGLGSSRMLVKRSFQRRRLTTDVRPAPKKMEGGGEDFRPPWVYMSARFMSLAVIPGVAAYSVFFYDFGEREHVFQPMRRWGSALVNSFFTLSPAEERRLQRENRARSTSAETVA